MLIRGFIFLQMNVFKPSAVICTYSDAPHGLRSIVCIITNHTFLYYLLILVLLPSKQKPLDQKIKHKQW